MTTEAFLYYAVRTPRGRGKKTGALYWVKPISLVVGLIDEIRRRYPGLDPAAIDDIILGCVSAVGDQGMVISRTAALVAGLPYTVAGVTLNRFCASGLEAVNQAAQKVRAGWDDLILAGGVESMSRVPMGSDGGAWAMDPETNYATGFIPQGISADLLATVEGLDRDAVDAYAARSHQRAAKAWADGAFDRSVVAGAGPDRQALLERDETIRPEASPESLGGLEPSFAGIGDMGGFDAVALQRYHWLERIDHVHTAGNSSGIVDGASLVLIGTEAAGQAAGLTPRARVVSAVVTGAEPPSCSPAPSRRAQGAGQGRPAGAGHLAVRGQRGVRGRTAAVHPRTGRRPRDRQRQRRRHRHGTPARRHRRHAARHAPRRVGAARRTRYGLATLCVGRRHGHRDHHRKALST